MKAQKSATDYLNDGPSRSVPLSRSVPAYLQIEEQLADRIEAGEFAPGDVAAHGTRAHDASSASAA